MPRSTQLSKLAATFAICTALAGCLPRTASVVTDTSCSAFTPITWSTRDTPDTILEVRQHNAAWVALCKAPHHGQ